MFRRLWTTATVAVLGASLAGGQGFTVNGRAAATDPDGVSFGVADAHVSLVSVSAEPVSGAAAPTVRTDRLGEFRFDAVPEGCYLVTGETDGLVGQSEPFCAPLPEGQTITLAMEVAVVVQTVEVTASNVGIDPSETSSTGSVGVSTLADAPKANKRIEDVMPLIPGVLRGPSGEINMNGSRAAQSGAQFNGVDVSDPVGGASQLSVPLEAVSNVQVLSNPYDAQLGGFTGAVSTVQTKPADFSDFKFSLQNFGPRMRRRDGSIMGIESFTPRLTVTGPIRRGKIAFLSSAEYQFVRADQEDANLPLLKRDVEREAVSLFTEVQAHHTERNSTTGGVLVFPEKLNFFGLDAFSLQESTPDLRKRGMLATLRNRHDFGSGASLVTQLSYQDLAADVSPRGEERYLVGLEKASGSYFYRQNRRSIRRKWGERYNFAPFETLGNHQLQAGLEFAAESYDGRQRLQPVTWLGVDRRPVLETRFNTPAFLRAEKTEFSTYLQDKWAVSPSLTLDLGGRLERDSIASRWNPAFRAGFAYDIGGRSRTVLRGGAGLFYDGINLNAPAFERLPTRLERRFGADGGLVEQTTFANQRAGPLRNPRSLGWSLQFDREVVRDLFVRLGYQQRRTTENLLVDREADVRPENLLERSGRFLLSNRGRDSYREWQLATRYRLPNAGHFTFSYVRSSAVGDLNALGAIVAATPASLILSNSRAPLTFDSPNRFLVWSEFGLPMGFRAVPVGEWRSGFPYSTFDESRRPVGARNRAGRFPQYQSIDLQITKALAFEFRGKKRRIRVGVRLFNLLNDFNPKDVQENIASPHYGVFYRGVKRKIRAVFEFGG